MDLTELILLHEGEQSMGGRGSTKMRSLIVLSLFMFAKADASGGEPVRSGAEAAFRPGFYSVHGVGCSGRLGPLVFVPEHGRHLIGAQKRHNGFALRGDGTGMKIGGTACRLDFVQNDLRVLGIDARILSHRGDSRIFPANTMPAFEAAMRQGYAGFELDVRLSKDGVAMVSHDDNLQVATNCDGTVASSTATEISGCTVLRSPLLPERRLFARKSKLPARIPTLREVLDHYLPDPRVHQIVVDLKEKPGGPTLVAALAVAASSGGEVERPEQKLTFISQDFSDISLLRNAFRGAHIALESNRTVSGLIDEPGDYWSNRSFDTFSISFNSLYDPKLKLVKLLRGENLTPKQRFRAFYQRNLKSGSPKRLLVWTVNNQPGVLGIRQYAFDDVLTDLPYERMVSILMKANARP